MKNKTINEGDIVYFTCEGLPICYHVGISVKEHDGLYIYHNTPSLFNKFGGNLVAEPLNDILKKRTVLKVVPQKEICPDTVREYCFNNRTRRWSAVKFNCEDFVNDIFKCRKYSKIRHGLFLGIGVFLISTLK